MANQKDSLRVLVTGWPGSGKSTKAAEIAKDFGLKHLCTDPQRMCDDGVEGVPDDLNWSEASQYVADHWLNRNDVVIEGVAVPRALRKWHNANPGQPPPCNQFILLESQFIELSQGQETMGKGIDKVLAEIYEWVEPVMSTKEIGIR